MPRRNSSYALLLPKLSMVYNPAAWNKPQEVAGRNCFAYATDELRLGFAWPGKFRDKVPLKSTSDQLIKDGFIRINEHELDPSQHHIFAFDGEGHFMRLDGDRTWSHKPGHDRATNLDLAGDAILHPLLYRSPSGHKLFDYWEYYTIPEKGIPFKPKPIISPPASQIFHWL